MPRAGTGNCVGTPLSLGGEGLDGEGLDGPGPGGGASGSAARVALVPASLGYVAAAGQLRGLLAAGIPLGAVLAGSDEGVLIANRLGAPVPVIDQVDVAAAADCGLVAVEVRRPGQPMTLLTDPVALAAALGLGDAEAGRNATASRALLDYGNGVIGLAAGTAAGQGPAVTGLAAPGPAEPWVMAHGRRIGLRLPAPSWRAGRSAPSPRRHPGWRDHPGRPVRGGPGRRGGQRHRPAGQRGPGRAGLVAAPVTPGDDHAALLATCSAAQ